MSLTVSFPRTMAFSVVLTLVPIILGSVLAQVWKMPVWAILVWLFCCLIFVPVFALLQSLVALDVLRVTISERFLEHDAKSLRRSRKVNYCEITNVWVSPAFCAVTTKNKLVAIMLPPTFLLGQGTLSRLKALLQDILTSEHPLRAKWTKS